MTDELKTLKDVDWLELEITGELPDFDIEAYENCGCDKPLNEQQDIMANPKKWDKKKLVKIEDLRNTAIKYVKHLRHHGHAGRLEWNISLDEQLSVYPCFDVQCNSIINFIKTFFNLTEEDLKS